MNRNPTLILAVVAIAAALGAGYWAGGRQPAGSGETVASAGADGAAPGEPAGKKARKILYYRNPMGLPDTSPEPKKDSMGMDYIAVYEGDEPDDSGVVKVSPARVQTLGVKTARAEERTLDSALRTVGRAVITPRIRVRRARRGNRRVVTGRIWPPSVAGGRMVLRSGTRIIARTTSSRRGRFRFVVSARAKPLSVVSPAGIGVVAARVRVPTG